MTTLATSAPTLLLNPRFRGEAPYGGPERRVMAESDAEAAYSLIRQWPDYRTTPEVEAPALAGRFGVGRLTVKYEGARFAVGSFKALGPPYAAMRLVASELLKRAGLTRLDPAELMAGRHRALAWDVLLMAATSGNHGRALAWAAGRFGCRCRIYMRHAVSAGRARVIESFGAKVVRVPGTFDDALERCTKDAEREGGFVVADLPMPDYPDVPRHTMHGYSVLASELADAWTAAGHVPSHLFVSAGIGSLAAAVVARLWQRFGARSPRVIVVEPLAAAGVLASAKADWLSDAEGDLETLMDGLSVRAVSPLAWAVLRRGAYAFLGIPDAPAVDAMKLAAAASPPMIIGETGIAALAGLLALSREPSLMRALGLDARSSVSVIACEGATDPDLYRSLTGMEPCSQAV